jgi:tRNA threonylcarbamoyladenosine biosynthesis protein TsaB
VALARDGALLTTYTGDGTITHGERLPGDLLRVLGGHALRIADVALFAVAAGPGSLTGLRIGIATMQGLALANGKSLVGVSALDALNEVVQSLRSDPEREVCAWMDAQRGQVFSAVYAGAVTAETAIVETPAAILARWRREGRRPGVFVGDGALAYRDLIRRERPESLVVEPLPPLAPGIARLALAHARQHGPSSPDAIRPVYIRRSDAELARDRRDGVQDREAGLKAG